MILGGVDIPQLENFIKNYFSIILDVNMVGFEPEALRKIKYFLNRRLLRLLMITHDKIFIVNLQIFNGGSVKCSVNKRIIQMSCLWHNEIFIEMIINFNIYLLIYLVIKIHLYASNHRKYLENHCAFKDFDKSKLLLLWKGYMYVCVN